MKQIRTFVVVAMAALTTMLLTVPRHAQSATPTATATFTASPTATPTPAVAPPANVAVSEYMQGASAILSWDDDAVVSQWLVFFGGRQVYQPQRSETGSPSTGRRSYLMTNIGPAKLPAVITMQAVSPGRPLSASSAAVTLTSNVPLGGGTVVYNEIGHPLYVNSVQGMGGVSPTSSSQVQYASLSYTAVDAAADGAIVVAAVPGRTIAVLGYSISTDTVGTVILHHQSGAVVLSNSASNYIGGGIFPAFGGEVAVPGTWRPGLAPGEPVTADFGQAVTKAYIAVTYVTY